MGVGWGESQLVPLPPAKLPGRVCDPTLPGRRARLGPCVGAGLLLVQLLCLLQHVQASISVVQELLQHLPGGRQLTILQAQRLELSQGGGMGRLGALGGRALLLPVLGLGPAGRREEWEG